MSVRDCDNLGPSRADSTHTEEHARAAPALSTTFVRPLPEVIQALGGNFAAALQQSGLPAGLFGVVGQRVRYPDLERLFKVCEQATSCSHVGLLVGQRLQLRDFGAAAGAALAEPTAGDGLGRFIAYCNLHDTPVTARMEVQEGRATFALAVTDHSVIDPRHFDYLGVAAGLNVLQALFGPHWTPVTARFSSRGPGDSAAFHALFRVPVEFGARHSEIEFEARWLAHPLPPLDPAARTAIAAGMQQARAVLLGDLPTALQRILRKRLLIGDFSMDDVAAQLSMHRRTLDRRLQRSGTTYGDVLEAVRDDIARQLLRNTRFSIQRVAESVRFSSAANFATAFRRRTGMTPTEYRRLRT